MMKKWILVLLLLIGTVSAAVSCTNDPSEIDRESVSAKTEAVGTPETGKGVVIGEDTDTHNWGALIPVPSH